ncbi:MAG: hypothetical protein HRT35_18075 [Algicola sp.]|nr:hypothetical protein [Algicola sp.]
MINRFTRVFLLILCVIVTSTASAGDNWQKIIIVKPEVTAVGPVTPAQLERMIQTSNDSYAKAVETLVSQLGRYYQVPPLIEFYQGEDFYQRFDSQGVIFLRQLAPRQNNDLVLSGRLELDGDSRRVSVQIDGFDSKNNTDWLVLMSPFSQDSLSYLPEVYTQLMFDLLNEPSATGLKPL